MHRILKLNLKEGMFYKIVEESLDLKLGVADKFGLKYHLSKTDHPNFNDLWLDTRRYLWDVGYRSNKFEQLKEYDNKLYKYWNKIDFKNVKK